MAESVVVEGAIASDVRIVGGVFENGVALAESGSGAGLAAEVP